MNEDVIVSIKGVRMAGEELEDIEVFIPAKYKRVGGSHIVKYEESIGNKSTYTKNMIKISDDKLDIIKQGENNYSMRFSNKDNKSMVLYTGEYGSIDMLVHTRNLSIAELEDSIKADIEYTLDMQGTYVFDCNMQIEIMSKSNMDMKLS